jgi:hypothetical protein
MAFLDDTGTPTGEEVKASDAAEMAKSMACTFHGERREDQVLQLINRMVGDGTLGITGGQPFVKTDELLSCTIGHLGVPVVPVVLQGRVDGIARYGTVGTPHLLEIKTRVHKLFRHARPFERAQCMAYLALVPDARSCLLAEALFARGIPDINVNRVPRDDDAWIEMREALVHRAAVLKHVVGHVERERVLLTERPTRLDDLCTRIGWPGSD